jgi:hypothetical protein
MANQLYDLKFNAVGEATQAYDLLCITGFKDYKVVIFNNATRIPGVTSSPSANTTPTMQDFQVICERYLENLRRIDIGSPRRKITNLTIQPSTDYNAQKTERLVLEASEALQRHEREQQRSLESIVGSPT